jgi:CheY-like chemotaxis protein
MTKAKIMIVEDEWVTADDIRMSLQSLGYTVTSVTSSGEEAIQNAEKDKPDLVLMDIVLEGKMDGIEAANEIRTNLNIPVVYLTAYADEKILERAKITEPFGYIVKPFITEDIRITIELALYKHKADKERK